MRFYAARASILLISLYVLCILVKDSSAAPAHKAELKKQQKHLTLIPDNVNLIKYENSNIGVDGYDFAFETSDGVSRKETATIKNLGTEQEAISVAGVVSWVGPDGIHYTLNYLADENGFQPEGKHLPVAPET